MACAISVFICLVGPLTISNATAVVLPMQVCPQISLRILDADYEEHNKTIKQIQVHLVLM